MSETELRGFRVASSRLVARRAQLQDRVRQRLGSVHSGIVDEDPEEEAWPRYQLMVCFEGCEAV